MMRSALLLMLFTVSCFLGPALTRAETPQTVTLSRRTAAYQLENSRKIRGYFPAQAEVEIREERTGGMVHVKYTSKSGKVVEALVRRTDLHLPLTPPAIPSRNQKENAWTEMEDGAFDTTALSDRGRKALALKDMKWRHAQTEHFVIHYEHGIFARRVARMAEFFYDYIPEDLGGVKDIRQGRSHIFIFRKPEKWKSFMVQAGNPDIAWAFAFVEGMVMYLQEADKSKASSAVLAHEMTHLVLNRYFPRQPPQWLNEGIAEWYGEFGRAAFKGIGKSKHSVFKDLNSMMALSELMDMKKYPSTDQEVRRFYDTAKGVVGYLRLEYPDRDFSAFLDDMIAGMSTREALKKHYGIDDLNQLQAPFTKFVRRHQ